MVAPLEGMKVVDMTEVQSGPSCTQMLAWLGADVIKIERPGGDPTRSELRDIPNADSLYYLQLNSNKKSVTLDVKTPTGKKILTEMLKDADMFVENLHPGAIEELGFGWEVVHKLNPKCIMGSIKGFNQGSRYSNIKAFEPVAQCAGGSATATGWFNGPDNIPTQSGAALGDSNSGMHLLIGLLAAVAQRYKTGVGCYVYQSMQNAVINLCRIKLRDQLILDHLGYLSYYAMYPYEKFGKTIPRPANAEGGGVLGWCYKCKDWATDDNDYVYIVIQRSKRGFEQFCEAMGFQSWLTDPKFSTPDARDLHKREIYAAVEQWTMKRSKEECVKYLGEKGVPVGPVATWYELERDPDLTTDGTIVKVDEGGVRGTYLTVGVPFTMSDFKPDIKRAPTLGENNAEVLAKYGYTTPEQLAKLKEEGVIQ